MSDLQNLETTVRIAMAIAGAMRSRVVGPGPSLPERRTFPYPGEIHESPTKRIQQIVAAVWGVPLISMPSPARTREWAWPRQAAMALCRDILGNSTPHIGRDFGGRDHTTVIHALRSVEGKLASRSPTLMEFARLYRVAEMRCRVAMMGMNL